MLMQGPHDQSARSQVFAHVENGDTVALPDGNVCVWDLTDRSAQAVGEVRGYRVLRGTLASQVNVAGFVHSPDGTDIPAHPSAASQQNNHLPPFLLQVYGVVENAILEETAVVTAPAAIVTDAADGRVTCNTTAGAICGFSMVDSVIGTVNPAIVFAKCM